MSTISPGRIIHHPVRKQAVATPLRFASVQNRAPNISLTLTSRNTYAFRVPHVLGNDMKDLVLGTQGWTMGEVNNGNDFTYVDVSIQAPNGTVVPVYWAGSRSRTVADGEYKVLSDAITASSLGYTFLPRNGVFWVKGRISVASSGLKVPVNGSFVAGDNAGSQAAYYDSAFTTPSSTDVAGVYTFTGTAAANNSALHSIFMLGHPVVDNPVYCGVGDSIMTGLHDSNAQGNFGRGLQQRAMHDGSFDNPVPSVQFSNSGWGIDKFIGTNVRWLGWVPYCNRGIDELLTNNISTRTLAQMKTDCQTLWSSMKTNGIAKIIRTQLLPKTTSTDNWTTTANQTIAADWGASDKAGQLNAWFAAQVGDAIESCVVMSSAYDATDNRKWAVNGVAAHMTDDGTHPYDNGANGVGSAHAAADLRAARIALN